jgi:Leucine-rich repeat (LRR) protein
MKSLIGIVLIGLFLSSSVFGASIYGEISLGYNKIYGANVKLKKGSQTVTTITSIDNGQYRFDDVELGSYTVEVEYDNLTSVSSAIDVQDASNNIKRDIWLIPADAIDIPELYEVSGVITDYTGGRYSNAEITFISTQTGFNYTATSDVDGEYSIQLPEAYYIISIEFRGVNPDYPGSAIYYSSQLGHLEVSSNNANNRNFLIPLKGVNIDATLNGAEVSASVRVGQNFNNIDPTTGENLFGYVSVENNNTLEDTLLPVGSDIIAVLASNDASDNRPFPSQVSISGLMANSQVEQIVQPLSAIGIILNIEQIADLDGNALTDVCVRATSSLNNALSFSSCEFDDGNLYLPPGNYNFNLVVRDPQWDPETGDDVIFYTFRDIEFLSLALINGQTTEVNRSFTMPIREVMVKVSDTEGQPISAAEVSLENSSGSIRYDASRSGSANIFGSKGMTDDAGIASLFISPLLGTLKITPPSNSALLPSSVEVTSLDTTEQINIVLNSNDGEPSIPDGDFVVFGKIENAAGYPFNGELHSRDANGDSMVVQVIDGNYAADFKGKGSFNLDFRIENPFTNSFTTGIQYLFLNSEVRVDETHRKNFVIPLLGIQGKVMTSSGALVQGITTSISSDFYKEDYSINAQIDGVSAKDGTFAISRLPNSAYINFGSVSFRLDNYYSISLDNADTNHSLDIVLLTEEDIVLRDSDSDEIPDFYEALYGDLIPGQDEDNDSLTNLQEANIGSNPFNADTDDDGQADSIDPFPLLDSFAHPGDLTFDGDDDDFTHIQEVIVGTDPSDPLNFPVPITFNSFTDSELLSCIEEQVTNAGHLYVSQVDYLYCDYRGIKSLEGMDIFINLRQLSVNENEISDVSSLSGLTALDNLNLGNNAISDLSPLSGLPLLESLDLYSNGISDLTGLTDLPSLYNLNLGNNNILDLSPLANLSSNSNLNIDLYGNDIVCTTERYFNSVSDIPILCLDPDLLEQRGYITTYDFESSEINPSIQFSGEDWERVDTGFESGFSFQSNDIFDDESTSFSITANTSTGVLSFYYYLDSEACCDYITFYIDDLEIQFYSYVYSDEPEWKQYVTLVEEGVHTFRWEYRKDGSASNGIDAVRIDDIVIPGFFEEQLSVLPNMTNEFINSLGRLSYDSSQEQFSLNIENTDGESLTSQVHWPVNYKDVQLHVMNPGESDDVGLFGIREDEGFEGRAQMFVRDALTGARVNVFNWPANWSEIQSKLLPDLNGDGVGEVAIQGHFKDGNRPQLVVKNGADGKNLRTFQFPDLWDNPQYMAFSDVTEDGIPEIALFGIIKRNGKPQIKVIDGTNPDNKLKAFTFPSNWENVSWNRLSDSNDDGEDDWGLFGRRIDDGRSQLIVKDARNPRGALSIYAWTSGFDNAQFYSVPDMDGDGIDEVAAGGYRSDIDRYQMTVKDGADRNAVQANYGWPNIWTEVSLHVVGDMTGDGVSEVVLFGKASDGDYQLAIKHGNTEQGEILRHSLGSDWISKPSLDVTNKVDADDLADMMFIGNDDENNSRVYTLGSSLLN